MPEKTKPESLSDEALLRSLAELNRRSRGVEADLVAHIAEVDARRLYAREAASSMHVYCTEVLEFTDFEAYMRITAARATRKFPALLTMLRDGRLHLTAVARLAGHLTPENWEGVLDRAAHRSKREIEELIAELAPRPDVPARMRKLPVRRPAAPSPTLELVPERVGDPPASGAGTPERVPPPSPSSRPSIEPLARRRYKVQFTADQELHDALEELQSLMCTAVPDGDLAQIIKVAALEKLERLRARRFARTKKPRKALAGVDTTPHSRHIPAPIRRAVHKRDGGRCTYRDAGGKRCAARHNLEFHHRIPFTLGGDHSTTNISLLCKTHNALMAEHDYGRDVVDRHRKRPDRVSEAASPYGNPSRTAPRTDPSSSRPAPGSSMAPPTLRASRP
jgi:5-methylcytosine-specific restriction endonuclease McrA